jgi:putative radical SAM enzyme (TIGR03279 family)
VAKIISLSKIARRQGLKTGDEIESVGGRKFCDVLDLIYFDGEDRFDIGIVRNGKKKTVKIVKKPEQMLDIETDCELKPAHCQNKCSFCFIDQLPRGLRPELYVKDDDYRFSFISGSYITLTNLCEDDIERIIRLKLSPLYISVHAFDDAVRENMLKNKKARATIGIIRRLSDAGIEMHAQIVMVPNLNDGVVLEQTISGLRGILGIKSVAVVPVGLTRHRENLERLPAVSKEAAQNTIDLVEKLNGEYGGFVWCADEFYIKAGRALPPYAYYGAFSQIENGVGLFRDFEANIDYALGEQSELSLKGSVGLVTGQSFAPYLKEFAERIAQKTGLNITVFAVKNNFFGESVTVAGLVTATDIAAQVEPRGIDFLVVPSNMLKEFSDVFLDNVTLGELEQKLGVKIIVASFWGGDLIEKIIEQCQKNL